MLRQEGTRPRAVAACHPLQSFVDPGKGADQVRNITFGIEGEPEGVITAQQLVESMGAHSFVVEDETRSEEHTSELQSRRNLVCRLLLEKKKRRHVDTTEQPI